MSIDQHVQVTARINNAGIALEGFGLIGIVTYANFFSERKREFARLSEVTALGYSSTSPEALAVAAALSQSPHPPRVALIRGTRPPTIRFDIMIEDVVEGYTYAINAVGDGVTTTLASYEAVGGDDEDDIIDELRTALNAVVGKNFTATIVVDASGPDMLRVTADAPGEWFTLEIEDTTKMSIVASHADPGIADDLADIAVTDNDYYYLEVPGASRAMILAAAAWVEAQPFKFYTAQSNDSDCENTGDGGTDVADDLNQLARKRTHLTYRRKLSEFFSTGLAARLAALPVGSWTAAYKTVVGSTYDSFTTQQSANLDEKRTSYYKREAGRSISWEGKVGNTDFGFWDITVAVDFLIDLIQKRAFGVFVALDKVGYTDEDISALRGAVEGAVDIAKSDKHKIVAPGTPGNVDTDPVPTVFFPKVKDIDPAIRAARQLPDGLVSCRVQGAVHSVLIDLTLTF